MATNAGSSEFSMPIEEMTKLDSAELLKLLDSYGSGFDSSEYNLGTTSDIYKLLEAAQTATGEGNGQLSNTHFTPIEKPGTQPQRVLGMPGRGRGGISRGAMNRPVDRGGRGANPGATSTAAVKNTDKPYVEIIEQPRTKGLRFRYECEGRSAGSIPGEHSTPEKKTFPAIKIHNHTGPAVVVVSCVTKDLPLPKPHPHALVGKDCTRGVCTVRVRDTSVVTFPQLGIQCAKKKDVEDHMKQRQEINVDPFQTGFGHIKDIDLNVVKLCFQVFLPGPNGKFTRIVKPVCSNPILDKKAHNELTICRIDHTSGRARGGDEVFLLCEKVNKDDITVRFYEKDNNDQTVWENLGDFGQGDVHRQLAIVFRTPPYRDPNIRSPKQVWLQLRRPTDAEVSDSIVFTYMPEDPDPHHIEEKRKRKCERLEQFINDGSSQVGTPANLLRERLKAKATRTRKIKQEQVDPSLPSYSLNNTGALPNNQAATCFLAGASGFNEVTYTNLTPVCTASSAIPTSQQQSGAVVAPVIFEPPDGSKLASQPTVDLQMTSIPEGQFPDGLNPSFASTMLPGAEFNSQGSNPVISDINFGGTAGTFDLTALQDYLRDASGGQEEGSAEMLSFGLSSDLLTTDYDPNVAAMESVSSDVVENDPETQRQCEEVHRALSNLN